MALEQIRLRLVQDLNGALDVLPCLRVQLLLGRAEDLFEDCDEAWCQLRDCGLILLVCSGLANPLLAASLGSERIETYRA